MHSAGMCHSPGVVQTGGLPGYYSVIQVLGFMQAMVSRQVGTWVTFLLLPSASVNSLQCHCGRQQGPGSKFSFLHD